MGPATDIELQPSRARRLGHYRTSCFLAGVGSHQLIQQQATENGQYELVTLPKTEGPAAGDGKDVPSEGKKGTGASAIFVARNRLAALDKTAQVSL